MASLFRAKPLSRFAKGEMARPLFQRTSSDFKVLALSFLCLGLCSWVFLRPMDRPLSCHIHFAGSAELHCQIDDVYFDPNLLSRRDCRVEWGSGIDKRQWSLTFLRQQDGILVFTVESPVEDVPEGHLEAVLFLKRR